MSAAKGGPERCRLAVCYVLDRVTGNDPSVTDYILVEQPAKCPQCRRAIHEKTSVEI